MNNNKIVSTITDAISNIKFFNGSDFKSTLLRMGIGLVITIISSGGLYFVYKWTENRSNHQIAAAVAAAHTAGVAETNSAAALAANKTLADSIKNLEDMQNKTQQKLDKIQETADASKTKIDSFDVGSIIQDHPEKVDKWANDTNNGLLGDISLETKK